MYKQTLNNILKRLIIFTLLIALLLPTVTVFANTPTSMYAQMNTFEASGSPLLNPNFTTNQWNKWETVAWGVFLSNFVVPMADSYESAFNTASNEGSRGSGFKALNFSMSGDPAARGILQDFLRFAIDSAMGNSKELHVSYYYLDQAGNIIEPSVPGDVNSPAKIVEKVKDPTKQDVTPEVTSVANFASLLPANLADLSGTERANFLNNDVGAWIAGTPYGSNKYDDVFGVNAVAYLPWDSLEMATGAYPHHIAIPPSVKSDYNKSVLSGDNKVRNYLSQYAKAYADSEKTSRRTAVKDIAV